MANLESVVIVKHKQGYVAHVRFDERQRDIDISNSSKSLLYLLVEGYIIKQGVL